MPMFCMDDMVPQNHMLRLIDKAIDWSFIYDLIEEKYYPNNGRPSIDPVMLIKIPFIQYLYGIKSMQQTMKALPVNLAHSSPLALPLTASAHHSSQPGKHYTRSFNDTDLLEQIFSGFLKKFSKGTCALASEAKPSVTSKVVAAKMRFNVFILMYFKVVILSVY